MLADENFSTAGRFGPVDTIPVVHLLKPGGEVFKTEMGYATSNDIEEALPASYVPPEDQADY